MALVQGHEQKTLEEVRLDLAMNLKTIRAEKGLAQ